MIKKYIDRLLKFIEEEKEEIKQELNQVEEHFGKPVVLENKPAEEYVLLLDKIKDYVDKKTKNGEYKPDDWNTINIQKMELMDLTTKELGTEDWKKYIIIFWSGKSKEFAIMTTNYGKKIWRQKQDGVRNPEGEKASDYWHRIKIIMGDWRKNNENTKFINPTEAI